MGEQKIESVYRFRGNKFVSYANVKEIRDSVRSSEKLKDSGWIDGIEDKQAIKDIYHYIDEKASTLEIEVVNDIFFESLMYCEAKHVFIDKIKPTNVDFEKIQELLKKKIMEDKELYPQDVERMIYKNGFFPMQHLELNRKKFFISGCRIKVDNCDIPQKLELVLAKSVNTDTDAGKEGYFITSVELDFKSHILLIMMKHTNGIERDEGSTLTLVSVYKEVIAFLLNNFNIECEPRDAKSDWSKLHKFCFDLDKALLDDVRTKVKKGIRTRTEKFIKNQVKSLKLDNKCTKAELDSIEEKFLAIFAAESIVHTYTANDIVNMAGEKGLLGYLTVFEFDNNRRKSKTGSAGSLEPLSGTREYHNLMTDFNEATRIKTFAISWFVDSEKKDVIQTRISTNTQRFHINCKALRDLRRKEVHLFVDPIVKAIYG